MFTALSREAAVSLERLNLCPREPVCRATETNNNLTRGMTKTVLITGGAGFIASHCAALLLQHNYDVKALDNLDAQIHGTESPSAELSRPPRGAGRR
jgi:FlaA1/EpsC-like NDP-sugar epimerase